MNIISNGSKFAGEELDTIDQLLEVLSKEPLDATFENYGNFFWRLPSGELTAWGNFANYSHVFNIVGTLEELRPIADAIKLNRKSVAYLTLKSSSNS